MIPYLLAVAGGYLIGNSMNETPKFDEGGVMAKGGEIPKKIVSNAKKMALSDGYDYNIYYDEQNDEFSFSKSSMSDFYKDEILVGKIITTKRNGVLNVEFRKMAEGGVMAKGGVFDSMKGGIKYYSVDIDLENGENIRGLEFKNIEKAKNVYDKYKKLMIYDGEKIQDIQLVKVFKNGDYEKFDKGGVMKKKQITIYKLIFSDDQSIYYFKGIDELRDFAIDRLDSGWETDVTEDDLKDDDKVIDFIVNDYGEELDVLMVITEDDFDNKS